MNRINVLGQMDNTNDGTLESANRVYGADGISPTIPTCGGGGIQPKILEICNMNNLTEKGNRKCLIAEQSRAEQSRAEQSRAEQSRAEQSLCPTSDKRGLHRMSSSGNCRSELSQKQNTKRKSTGKRADMSDIDNGEYP